MVAAPKLQTPNRPLCAPRSRAEQDLLQIRSYVYAEEPSIDIHNFVGTFTRVSGGRAGRWHSAWEGGVQRARLRPLHVVFLRLGAEVPFQRLRLEAHRSEICWPKTTHNCV